MSSFKEVEVTEDNYWAIKLAYELALNDGYTEFTVLGGNLDVKYAKYLLEYMKDKLNIT